MNERGEAAYTHAEQAERHATCWPADVSLQLATVADDEAMVAAASSSASG
jgi:hypothetical protein